MSDSTTNSRKTSVYETRLKGLDAIYQGKVRDLFAIDDEHMLIVASDRLSAFDVVMPEPIPGKGQILTQITNFWFDKTDKIIRSHRADLDIEEVLTDNQDREQVRGRAMVVKRLKALPVEAVVRGYLIGSGWKDYQKTGMVCGIPLPAQLKMADKLPEPIFTPATKAEKGEHDENIDFDTVVNLIGKELAEKVRAVSIEIYNFAADYALQRGIILADTKFEFGLDEDGELVLIDEILTPDSSRYWPAESYQVGISPPSFDKQFVRDYLETLDWNKTAPGPKIPLEIRNKSADKYEEALLKLTDKTLDEWLG
ncbi:MAG: phosphoribosylaminoimidazolesuccinocarboxamide synthase [Gammaproteobacteria bacterium]|nr:phosphoribosylaminoimidazolesuccinocarboxamide synthase [Gammaproteobacteria bacterium]NNC97613.1 phosphoribosylaminoimidazolesuccinocarboxamide synthase [Gammaproteobacteria bacterium]NNM14201.1 phosphoribosylaminoimidazolesuccinocarboxamide synthase [Gammaproteobacteria bacterium]